MLCYPDAYSLREFKKIPINIFIVYVSVKTILADGVYIQAM